MTASLPALLALLTVAQPDTVSAQGDNWQGAERLEMNDDVSEEFASLAWRMEHPLDLNAASRDEFLTLPFISQGEVDSLLRWRKSSHGFRQTDDLALHGEPGKKLLQLVRPFVVVSPRQGRLLTSRFRRDWEGSTAGFVSTGWIRTNPVGGWEIDAKMREVRSPVENFRQWQGGIVTTGRWGSAFAGDLRMWSGEGMVFGQSSVHGEGFSLDVDRRIDGIRLSTSTIAVMRGAGIELNVGEKALIISLITSVQPFASMRLPGILVNEQEVHDPYMPARFTGGTEQLWGGRLSVVPEGGLQVGMTGWYSSLKNFSIETGPVSDRRVWVVGTDCHYRRDALNIAAELAISRGAGSAFGTHAVLQLGPDMQCGVGGRWYSPAFWNPHAVGIEPDGHSRSERSTWGIFYADPFTWLTVIFSLRQSFKQSFEAGFPLEVARNTCTLLLDAALRKDVRCLLSYRTGETDDPTSAADTLGRRVRMHASGRFRRISAEVIHRNGIGFHAGVKCEGAVTGDATMEYGGIAGAVFLGWSAGQRFDVETTLVIHEADEGGPVFWMTERPHPGSTDLVGLYGAGTRISGRFRLHPVSAMTISCAFSHSRREDTLPPTEQWSVSGQVEIRW